MKRRRFAKLSVRGRVGWGWKGVGGGGGEKESDFSLKNSSKTGNMVKNQSRKSQNSSLKAQHILELELIPVSLCLSLSLSLTHTHKNTHTF